MHALAADASEGCKQHVHMQATHHLPAGGVPSAVLLININFVYSPHRQIQATSWLCLRAVHTPMRMQVPHHLPAGDGCAQL